MAHLPMITLALLLLRGHSFAHHSLNLKSVVLYAKPQRLKENVEGVLYVNDKCINCAACHVFAPASFSRSDSANAHVVHHQPSSPDEIETARAAMAACPVAAIRIETLAERRHAAADKAAIEASWTQVDQSLVEQMSLTRNKLFPRPFLDDDSLSVYWLGHHNEASFGATPYLLESWEGVGCKPFYIMVDTPKYSKSSVAAVEQITGSDGPSYLVLTHVDDTADHGKWAQHYQGALKRVFHAGDLGRHNWLGDTTLEDVEVLLQPLAGNDTALTAYTLDGTLLHGDAKSMPPFMILHTPGHSPGSITLWDRQRGILFTGDTYAWTTRDGGHMSGFPRYGHDLRQQSETLRKLVDLPQWKVVAPGHGHPRDYRKLDEASKKEELDVALEELKRKFK